MQNGTCDTERSTARIWYDKLIIQNGPFAWFVRDWNTIEVYLFSSLLLATFFNSRAYIKKQQY